MSEAQAVLSQIEKAAGADVVAKLCRRLGGTSFYVARNPRAGSLLTETVGIEAAKKIAVLFGGETIGIPLGPAANATRRRRAIRRLLRSGHSAQEIARRIGCHARTVMRQAAEMRREGWNGPGRN